MAVGDGSAEGVLCEGGAATIGMRGAPEMETGAWVIVGGASGDVVMMISV